MQTSTHASKDGVYSISGEELLVLPLYELVKNLKTIIGICQSHIGTPLIHRVVTLTTLHRKSNILHLCFRMLMFAFTDTDCNRLIGTPLIETIH